MDENDNAQNDASAVATVDPGFRSGAHDTNDLRFQEGAEAAEPDERAGVPKAIEKASVGVREAQVLEPEEVVDAMEWLLGDEMAGGTQGEQTWKVNVGTDEHPRWVEWTISALDADTMNQIRAQARVSPTANRAARRAQRGADASEVDMYEMNLRIVAAATIYPDLRDAAEKRGLAAADPVYGPVELLRGMFRLKPGIVSQIAGFVMQFSGYDDDDVVRATPEITMVRAAGNSSGRAAGS